MINLKNITKSYGDICVLKDLNLSIVKSEVTSIVGASGAGKSTLLQIMGTLLEPTTGDVYIDGQQTNILSSDSLSALRNMKVGFVFQFHHLLPEFTAIENVCIPALIAKKNKAEVEKRAKEVLSMLDMSHRITHKPSELSGGEQQRIAIARAVINNPSILLADEPSGNLDSKNREELHNMFFRLRDTTGQTIVIVTHDDELANMCDRKIVMRDGNIINDEYLWK